MLYKHDHLEKRLREHGRAATAEILSIKTEGEGSSYRALFSDDSDLTTTWFNCRLKLRISPDGEAPFEATVHTRLNTIKSDGDTVPVLYDPDDHGDVFVDYEADARARMDSNKAVVSLPSVGGPEVSWAVEAELARRRAGGSAPAASGDHLDRLQQLADLRDRGALTDAEFAAEKARILSES